MTTKTLTLDLIKEVNTTGLKDRNTVKWSNHGLSHRQYTNRKLQYVYDLGRQGLDLTHARLYPLSAMQESEECVEIRRGIYLTIGEEVDTLSYQPILLGEDN